MHTPQLNKHIHILSVTLFIILGISLVSHSLSATSKNTQIIDTEKFLHPDIAYKGPVHHIFFHSLLAYPEITFRGDKRSKFFESYMITSYEFKHILTELYANNYVLIDIHSLYTVSTDGTVAKKPLFLPANKNPSSYLLMM